MNRPTGKWPKTLLILAQPEQQGNYTHYASTPEQCDEPHGTVMGVYVFQELTTIERTMKLAPVKKRRGK